MSARPYKQSDADALADKLSNRVRDRSIQGARNRAKFRRWYARHKTPLVKALDKQMRGVWRAPRGLGGYGVWKLTDRTTGEHTHRWGTIEAVHVGPLVARWLAGRSVTITRVLGSIPQRTAMSVARLMRAASVEGVE